MEEGDSSGDQTVAGLRWLAGFRRASRTGRVFEEVLSEHFDALYRTALRLCSGIEADAEDLMQEVAFRAFRHYRELRDIEAARSWLFTILMRTHFNRVRAAKRRREVAIDDLDETAFERALEEWRAPETPESVLDRSRLGDRFEAAMNALDPALRTVILLVDVEGFRQWEVARMLSIPAGTVASRLYRARCELREMLLTHSAERRHRTRQEG
jgi:RNA polymerase sigma-70 factor (ECF subfamily)